MTDHITLRRAVVEEVRSAIRGFYNKYSDEAVHEDAGRAIAALDAALAEPEPQECWCHKCNSGWLVTHMIVCPTCGNKRCPRASDHELPCTDSNEPGQPGSVYALVAPEPDAKREPATREQVAEAYKASESDGGEVIYCEAWRDAERFHEIGKEDK
jgi:hypothetical protein